MKTIKLEVVEVKTGKVVHTVDTHSTSESKAEKVLSGMLRNMDTERFVVREVKS